MPVPCERDFGLADEAATAAKRMQNAAALEANLSRSQRQWAADDRMMLATCQRACSHLASRAVIVSPHMRWHRTPMDVARPGQPTDWLQMLRDVESRPAPAGVCKTFPHPRRRRRRLICRIPIVQQAPVTAISRTARGIGKLKPAAFCQASALSKFLAASAAAQRMTALSAGKFPYNPGGRSRDSKHARPKSVTFELAVVVVCRIFCQM